MLRTYQGLIVSPEIIMSHHLGHVFALGYRSTASASLMADKTTYGSYVHIYEDDEHLTLRLLVSVLKSLAQFTDQTLKQT